MKALLTITIGILLIAACATTYEECKNHEPGTESWKECQRDTRDYYLTEREEKFRQRCAGAPLICNVPIGGKREMEKWSHRHCKCDGVIGP